MSKLSMMLLASCLLLAGSSSVLRVGAQTTPQYPTVLDALQGEAGFTTVITAATLANLASNLTNPDLQAIILAPNDEAFANTLANFPGAIAFATGGPAALVLQYHIIPTNTANEELNITDGATLLTLLSSVVNSTFQSASISNVTFKTFAPGQAYVGGVLPGATLSLNTSITAGKSRIYTLEGGLLVPPSRVLTVFPDPNNLTLAEALSNSDQFSLIRTLVEADDVLAAFVANPDQAVTLFAPTDAAVTAALESLNVSASDLAGTATARRIVLNHIIPSRPYAAISLPQGTTTLPTASDIPADALSITFDGTTVTVQGAGNGSPIDVVAANISAGKSVVHAISGVILPSSSNSTTANPPPAATATPPPPAPPPAPTNIIEALDQLGLTSLTTTIQIANLTNDLSDPTLAVTVLAPSNAAFQQALVDYPVARTVITNGSLAGVVLAYHLLTTTSLANLNEAGVTLGTVLSVNAPQAANTSLYNVTLKPQANGAVYAGGLAPGGVFSLSNATQVGNSTIYVIDGVLVPPSKALGGGNLSLTLLEALNATPSLSILATIIRNDSALLAFVSDPDQAVTVFAPTNDVFTAFAASQNLTLTGLLGTALARRIVLNHIIPVRPFSSRSIPATTSTGPITLPSAQPGDLLNVTSTGGASPNVTVQGAGNAAPVNVVATNVTAGKSVVHLVDGVILPNLSQPAPPSGGSITTTPPTSSPSLAPPPSPGGAAAVARASAPAVVLTALLGAALALLALA